MKYKETYKIEPARVFDGDSHVSDFVLAVLAVIALAAVGAFA